MVFWVSNHYKDEDEGWNLSRLGQKLTRGIADPRPRRLIRGELVAKWSRSSRHSRRITP